jgi:hypothetical protein
MKAAPKLIACLALAVTAYGQDDILGALGKTLAPMRSDRVPDLDRRGATPQLTIAKHQLRDWIESRLPPDSSFDPLDLAANLNDQLKAKKLVFDDSKRIAEQAALGPSDPGWVGEIRMKQANGRLIVQTALGIMCGFDESAYLYQWSEGHWERHWESEQNNYTKGSYKPQHLHGVLTSPVNPDGSYLVLTFGDSPWCTSNISAVYYRLWRIGPESPQPKKLLDETASSFGRTIEGALEANDVLVEFTTHGRDPFETVRHYRVDRDRVTQIDPIAPSPRDFVATWLTEPWAISAARSAPSALAKLRQVYQTYNRDLLPYPEATLRCSNDPQLRQVNSSGDYFLVRWQQPYRFTKVDVRDTPFPRCTQPDSDADKRRTLFPDSH